MKSSLLLLSLGLEDSGRLLTLLLFLLFLIMFLLLYLSTHLLQVLSLFDHLFLQLILLVSLLIRLEPLHGYLFLLHSRASRRLLLLLLFDLLLASIQQVGLVLHTVFFNPLLCSNPLDHLLVKDLLHFALPPLHDVPLSLDRSPVALLVKPSDLSPVQLCVRGVHPTLHSRL